MTTDDALKDALKQVARAKVAEVLGGDVLGRMVQAVMDHRRSLYGSRDEKRTELERIVDDLLEGTIREAVADYLKEEAAAIKASVRDALVKAGADTFAARIVDAFATDDWRATLNVSIDRGDD